jgi:prefoldin subunit 5
MLLEIQTTHERLQRELNLLRREIELLKTMLEKLPRLPDQGLFSLN